MIDRATWGRIPGAERLCRLRSSAHLCPWRQVHGPADPDVACCPCSSSVFLELTLSCPQHGRPLSLRPARGPVLTALVGSVRRVLLYSCQNAAEWYFKSESVTKLKYKCVLTTHGDEISSLLLCEPPIIEWLLAKQLLDATAQFH